VLGIDVFVRDMTQGVASGLGSNGSGILDCHLLEEHFRVLFGHASESFTWLKSGSLTVMAGWSSSSSIMLNLQRRLLVMAVKVVGVDAGCNLVQVAFLRLAGEMNKLAWVGMLNKGLGEED
jgi:hypothetical protein